MNQAVWAASLFTGGTVTALLFVSGAYEYRTSRAEPFARWIWRSTPSWPAAVKLRGGTTMATAVLFLLYSLHLLTLGHSDTVGPATLFIGLVGITQILSRFGELSVDRRSRAAIATREVDTTS